MAGVARLLNAWCTNVLRSKVEPMKKVAEMIRSHFDGILAWVHSRQTNGFLEAINGLFQAAKRKARGYVRFKTIRTVIFMIAGKLDFSRINPYVAASPTQNSTEPSTIGGMVASPTPMESTCADSTRRI
jgi:hypothetical protein